MRILHIENPAGAAFRLSRGQRKICLEADVLETWKLPYDYGHDIENYYRGGPSDLIRLFRTVRIGRRYDIIHLHTGLPLKRLDVVTLRAILRKPLVVHYHGSETRMGYGMHYRSLVDLKLVATPDLLEYHRDALYVPNAMDQMEMAPFPAGKFRIVHVPTNRDIKGTALLERSLEELRAKYDFELEVVEGVPHAEALKALKRAHLVVDEVGDPSVTGVKGRLNVLALEAMMLGRPVITNLEPELLIYYPDCPVMNVASKGTMLKERLIEALEGQATLPRTGAVGHDYVRKNHDPEAVASKVLDLYKTHLRIRLS